MAATQTEQQQNEINCDKPQQQPPPLPPEPDATDQQPSNIRNSRTLLQNGTEKTVGPEDVTTPSEKTTLEMSQCKNNSSKDDKCNSGKRQEDVHVEEVHAVPSDSLASTPAATVASDDFSTPIIATTDLNEPPRGAADVGLSSTSTTTNSGQQEARLPQPAQPLPATTASTTTTNVSTHDHQPSFAGFPYAAPRDDLHSFPTKQTSPPVPYVTKHPSGSSASSAFPSPPPPQQRYISQPTGPTPTLNQLLQSSNPVTTHRYQNSYASGHHHAEPQHTHQQQYSQPWSTQKGIPGPTGPPYHNMQPVTSPGPPPPPAITAGPASTTSAYSPQPPAMSQGYNTSGNSNSSLGSSYGDSRVGWGNNAGPVAATPGPLKHLGPDSPPVTVESRPNCTTPTNQRSPQSLLSSQSPGLSPSSQIHQQSSQPPLQHHQQEHSADQQQQSPAQPPPQQQYQPPEQEQQQQLLQSHQYIQQQHLHQSPQHIQQQSQSQPPNLHQNFPVNSTAHGPETADASGGNSNDSCGAATPGTPNSQGMRPTPSPTGSTGSRSMSPAISQQNTSIPPRPSSGHSDGSGVGSQNRLNHCPMTAQQTVAPASSSYPPPPIQQPHVVGHVPQYKTHPGMVGGPNGQQQTPMYHPNQQQYGYTGKPPTGPLPPPPPVHSNMMYINQPYPPPPPPSSTPSNNNSNTSSSVNTVHYGQQPQFSTRTTANHMSHTQFAPYYQQQQQPSPPVPPQQQRLHHHPHHQQQHMQSMPDPDGQQQQPKQDHQTKQVVWSQQQMGGPKPSSNNPPTTGSGGPIRPPHYLKQHLQHKMGFNANQLPIVCDNPNSPQNYHMGPPPNAAGMCPPPPTMGPPGLGPYGQQQQPSLPPPQHTSNSHSYDGGPMPPPSSTPNSHSHMGSSSEMLDNGIATTAQSTFGTNNATSNAAVASAGSSVTSVITTGPDGTTLDEGSQQSTLSNTSVASGEDPQCTTPKSRGKCEVSHYSHPTTPLSAVPSPGAASMNSMHEEYGDMSSPSWPRTPASPKTDSLSKLYEMDDTPDRRIWLDKLLAFMDDRRTPITTCPTISKNPLDLFRLYIFVKDRGGFMEVTKNKSWKDIAGMLGIGASSSAAYTLRKHYTKNLLAYECQFDRGGIDPQPIINQVENTTKKKTTKSVSVPSPGSSNSQDSFPPSGSNAPSLDGFGYNYPPPGSSADYNARPQRPPSQSNIPSPHGNANPNHMNTGLQRDPSPAGGTTDNVSVSNPFDDVTSNPSPARGNSSFPSGSHTPYPSGAPTPRQQQAPPPMPSANYTNQTAYNQYGATNTPNASMVVDQYGSYSPANYAAPTPSGRSLYPNYSAEVGGPQQVAAASQGPASGQDHYNRYCMTNAPSNNYPQRAAYSNAPPGGGGATAGMQPPVASQPPGGSYSQQEYYRPDQSYNSQSAPNTPTSYPSGNKNMPPPGGQPPRRHPDFSKDQQSYPHFSQQRPQIYNWSGNNQYRMPQYGGGGGGGGGTTGAGAAGAVCAPMPSSQQWPQPNGRPTTTQWDRYGGGAGQGGGGGYQGAIMQPPLQQQQPPQQQQQQQWATPMSGPPPMAPNQPSQQMRQHHHHHHHHQQQQQQPLQQQQHLAHAQHHQMGPNSSRANKMFGMMPGPGSQGGPSVVGMKSGGHHMPPMGPSGCPPPPGPVSVSGSGSYVPQGQMTKREITFPVDSVEATTPVLYRRKRLCRSDIGQIDPWRIIMSLRSGLLSESVYSLDVLNILLFDDTSVGYFGLHQWPSLLDIILEHFQKSLSDVFDTSFPSLTTTTATTNSSNSNNFSDSNSSSINSNSESVNNNISVSNEDSLKSTVLKNTTNYTYVTHKGYPVKLVDRQPDAYIQDYIDLVNRGGNSKLATYDAKFLASVPSDPWQLATDHIIPTFRAEFGCIPFYTKLRYSNNSNSNINDNNVNKNNTKKTVNCTSSGSVDEESKPTADSCVEKSQIKNYTKNESSISLSMQKAVSSTNVTTNVDNDSSNSTEEHGSESKIAATNFNDGKEDKQAVQIKDNGSETIVAVKVTTTTNDNNVKVALNAQPSKTSSAVTVQHGMKRRRLSIDCEDEAYSRDEASLVLITESQDNVGKRCVCISNILRSLSFIPGNETEFAHSATYLAIVGKLLLFHHDHPKRIPKARNYDREEDADFMDSCSSLQGENEWWWEYLFQIRENILVSISNVCGQIDFNLYSEEIVRPILDGLLHWAICPSAAGQDPFSGGGSLSSTLSVLSPQRLALEALCKLCVTNNNVDLVIATPPFSRLERLCTVLTKHLCRNEDQVLREFSVNLLHYLAAADSGMARTVALQSPCVSLLVAFIEQAEQSALGVANQHGISALRDNPDSMGTSLDMLRRAAATLVFLARHPDNKPLLVQHETRLLALVMSQILDQQVALLLSKVLFQISRS